MKKLLFVYLGEISDRFQNLSLYFWYTSLFVCALSLSSLISLGKPSYFEVSILIYNLSLKVFLLSSLVRLLPTKEFVRYCIGISLMDDTVRKGLLYKASRTILTISKGKITPRSLYSKYAKETYFKWLYFILYLWDLRKIKTQIKVLVYTGYSALIFLVVNYLLSFVTKPFFYDLAIRDVAIGSLIFLASTIIKIMFIPSLDTIKEMLVVYIFNKLNDFSLQESDNV